MADLLEELRKAQRLRGDTYSSYEVVGLVGQAADEIERLREALRDTRKRLRGAGMLGSDEWEGAPDGLR